MNKQTIIDAVNNKRNISFAYQGHLRDVSPHWIGEAADGEVFFRCLQWGGSSSDGIVGGDGFWKTMKLAEVERLLVLSDTRWMPLQKSAFTPPTFIVNMLAVAS